MPFHSEATQKLINAYYEDVLSKSARFTFAGEMIKMNSHKDAAVAGYFVGMTDIINLMDGVPPEKIQEIIDTAKGRKKNGDTNSV